MLKSRRQARLTNKTKLEIYRGGEGESWEVFIVESEENKGHLNSDGVEKGEDQGTHLLRPWMVSQSDTNGREEGRKNGRGKHEGGATEGEPASTSPLTSLSSLAYHFI